MRIFAVAGSPRRNGNSALLLEQALQTAEELGATIDKVYANELKLTGCQACNSCRQSKHASCRLLDDMQELYPKLLRADVICLATPLYWWGPSAQLKLFIDRWYALSNQRESFKNKTLALIITQGNKNLNVAQPITAMFNYIAEWLGMNYLQPLVVSAVEKGDVLNNTLALVRAKKYGEEMCSYYLKKDE